MLARVKPETEPMRPQPQPKDEAELRAAIDAAERDALLSPEAFLSWLEGKAEESDQLD